MTTSDAVKLWLAEQQIEVLEFTEQTATAATAAAAVGCSVAEIAKTLLFLVGGKPVAVVTSGDMKVNSSRLKQFFRLTGKVSLPHAEEVKSYTGYLPGGVCPFLLPPDLPLVLDISLQRFAQVYPAAGDDRSAVPLTVMQLQQLAAAPFADVCEPLDKKPPSEVSGSY